MKNDRRINSILPCKFGHFWRELNFRAPKTPILDARGAQTRYDMKFYAHLRILWWPLLRGRGVGVCLSSVTEIAALTEDIDVGPILSLMRIFLYGQPTLSKITDAYIIDSLKSVHEPRTIRWCIYGTDVFTALMYLRHWCIYGTDVFTELMYLHKWRNITSGAKT